MAIIRNYTYSYFGVKYANKIMCTPYQIATGSILKYVDFCLGRVPNGWNDGGLTVTTDVSRIVRAAVWINEPTSSNQKPDYVSSNTINTGYINGNRNLYAPEYMETHRFYFDTDRIWNPIIYIGLISDNGEYTSMAYEKDKSTYLIYNQDTNLSIWSKHGIKVKNISLQSYPDESSNPSFTYDDISEVISRTNSFPNSVHADNIWDDSKPMDFYGLGEGCLPDVDLTDNKQTQSYVFSKSRIRFQILPWKFGIDNGIDSRIEYRINYGDLVYSIKEGSSNSIILIRPSNFEISDNNSMVISFRRVSMVWNNETQNFDDLGSSPFIDIKFLTYEKPSISIVYPLDGLAVGYDSSITDDNGIPIPDENGVYQKIRSSINISFTSDYGDGSGYKIGTRFYIEERDLSNNPTGNNVIFDISDSENSYILYGYNVDPDKPENTHRTLWKNPEDNNPNANNNKLYLKAGYKYRIRTRRYHEACIAGYNWEMSTSNGGNALWAGPSECLEGDVSDGDNITAYPGFAEASESIIEIKEQTDDKSNDIYISPVPCGTNHFLLLRYYHTAKGNGTDGAGAVRLYNMMKYDYDKNYLDDYTKYRYNASESSPDDIYQWDGSINEPSSSWSTDETGEYCSRFVTGTMASSYEWYALINDNRVSSSSSATKIYGDEIQSFKPHLPPGSHTSGQIYSENNGPKYLYTLEPVENKMSSERFMNQEGNLTGTMFRLIPLDMDCQNGTGITFPMEKETPTYHLLYYKCICPSVKYSTNKYTKESEDITDSEGNYLRTRYWYERSGTDIKDMRQIILFDVDNGGFGRCLSDLTPNVTKHQGSIVINSTFAYTPLIAPRLTENSEKGSAKPVTLRSNGKIYYNEVKPGVRKESIHLEWTYKNGQDKTMDYFSYGIASAYKLILVESGKQLDYSKPQDYGKMVTDQSKGIIVLRENFSTSTSFSGITELNLTYNELIESKIKNNVSYDLIIVPVFYSSNCQNYLQDSEKMRVVSYCGRLAEYISPFIKISLPSPYIKPKPEEDESYGAPTIEYPISNKGFWIDETFRVIIKMPVCDWESYVSSEDQFRYGDLIVEIDKVEYSINDPRYKYAFSKTLDTLHHNHYIVFNPYMIDIKESSSHEIRVRTKNKYAESGSYDESAYSNWSPICIANVRRQGEIITDFAQIIRDRFGKGIAIDINSEYFEMLYLDYIVRNMCLMYYNGSDQSNTISLESATFDYNRYHHKVILRQHFVDLDNYLRELVSFINRNEFMGSEGITDQNRYARLKELLKFSPNIEYTIIGEDIFDYNYIQELMNEIETLVAQ